MQCKPEVGRAAVDPITSHGLPSSPHRHIFFANRTLLTLPDPDSATYDQLVGGGTTCQNPDETAPYWVPDLVYTSGPNAGSSVPVSAMTAYYRSFDGQEVGVAQALPPDARVVAGDAEATGPQPTRVVGWGCDQRSTRRGPYPSITAAACNTATGKVRLTAHVTLPSCWDGLSNDHTQVGNTADYRVGSSLPNHYAYPVRKQCPAGYPVAVTQVTLTVWWSYAGDGTDVALTSDQMMWADGIGVAPGTTLHADLWNTWVQTGGTYGGLVGMVRDCVNTTPVDPVECGA